MFSLSGTKLRVLYDAAVLGVHENVSRGGIYRTVENLACGLVESNQCELAFCAGPGPEIAMRCHDYLASHARLSGVPLINDSVAATSQIHGLSRRLRNTARHQFLHLRLWRDILRIQERWSRRINARRLSSADIFHATWIPAPPEVRAMPRLKQLITVNDIIPKILPHYAAHGTLHMLDQLLSSMRPQDWLAVCSESTRNDLCEHYGMQPSRIFVIPWAADERLFYSNVLAQDMQRVRLSHGIPEGPYFLSVCTLEPRKNLAHTIRCFARVLQQEKIQNLSLVLVGEPGWKNEAMNSAVQELADPSRLIFTGHVSDRDLAPLYAGAQAFLYPSFYEGFGLPPLEAMQCGTPVVTSNTSSLPEVVGDAAIMVSPTDSDALCAAMLSLYQDASLRKSLSERGVQRARQFSWRRCAEETLAAYRQIVAARF